MGGFPDGRRPDLPTSASACVLRKKQRRWSEAAGRVATAAKKLLLSTDAVRAVCRPKCLVLRINHTPAPLLPRSNGDMLRTGKVAADESGAIRSASRAAAAPAMPVALPQGGRGAGGRMGRHVSSLRFGGIAQFGAVAAC